MNHEVKNCYDIWPKRKIVKKMSQQKSYFCALFVFRKENFATNLPFKWKLTSARRQMMAEANEANLNDPILLRIRIGVFLNVFGIGWFNSLVRVDYILV